MTTYSDEALTDKLKDLNNSAPSIQGVSLWLLHHRKHYKNSVQVWFRELSQVGNERKLTLLYLANDVVQNARKKYPEVGKEFGTVMIEVFNGLSELDLDKKTIANIGRLVNIWRSRQIFQSTVQKNICNIWNNKMGIVLDQSDEGEPAHPAKRLKTTSVISSNKESTTVVSNRSDTDDIHDNNKVITESGDRLDIADCRRSLVMALQQLEEVENAQRSVSSLTRRVDDGETGEVYGDLQHHLVEELLARSRVSQLVAGVLSTQQELVARTEERLGEVRVQIEKVKDNETKGSQIPDS